MIDESSIKSEMDYFHKEKDIVNAIIGGNAKLEQLSELIEILSEKSDNEIIKKIISKYKAEQKKINANLPVLKQDLKDMREFYKSKFRSKKKERTLTEKITEQSKKASEFVSESNRFEKISVSTDAKCKFVCQELKRLEKQAHDDAVVLEYVDFLRDLSEKLIEKAKVDSENMCNSARKAMKEIDILLHLVDRNDKGLDEPELE